MDVVRGSQRIILWPIAMAPGAKWVLLAAAMSGMTALASEVVWTRLLSLNLGGTVYSFSLILAAFLLGIGLGSGGGSVLAAWVSNPRRAFGVCQLLLILALAWAAFMATGSMPYWPINPILSVSPWFNFQIDFFPLPDHGVACGFIVGRKFPACAGSGVASREQDTGNLSWRGFMRPIPSVQS